MDFQIDKIYNEDCLTGMKRIADGAVDCIITDLPYGTTCCPWDCVIPFEPMWAEFRRVIRHNGVICLFATQPFTTALIASNMQDYRYSWIWEKDSPNGFLNANYAPLKITEDICVFAPYATVGSLSKTPIKYNPQGVRTVNRRKRNNPNSTYRASQGYTVGGNKLNSNEEYIQRFEGYPNNILRFRRDTDCLHPTQKPVDLIRYLILTYTDMGGGSFGCHYRLGHNGCGGADGKAPLHRLRDQQGVFRHRARSHRRSKAQPDALLIRVRSALPLATIGTQESV